VFERECTKCHGNAAVERAPIPAAIRQMPPERIYAALTTGVMKTQAANLTDEQKRRLAEYMGGRPLGSAALGDASQMPNHCTAELTFSDPSKSPEWTGWGVDVRNTRFQSAEGAGLTPAQIPNLKLKWAFGFPLGVSAFGRPSVASGRVFVGSDIGYVYSLDMHSGCVYWSYQTKAGVRTAATIGRASPGSPRYSATEPAPDTSDSILAVDLDTGKLQWHFQAELNDATLGGCFAKKTENCPDNPGPDWDFGASPVLKTLASGRDLLLAPNKSGIIFALDPDRKGAVVWKTNVAEKQGTRNTNVVWGGSADQQNFYVGLTTGAIAAVQIATGEKLWTTRLAPSGSRVSYAAASSAIPGAVFIAGTDGKIHALSTADGRELWSFETAHEFTTVNQVPAHGGSIGSIGPTIADGMVFIGSGYSVAAGIPGNVLLAFAAQ
jgi:outer membrane protein assembly factor BamB